jgi:tRNA-splicing ligase RtcB
MEHPRLFRHVAIMPDVHAGVGATIGSVVPLVDAVIPSAVGVDIGCGMCSVKSSAKVSDINPLLKQIYEAILSRIPRGFNHRTQSQKADVHSFGNKEVIDSLRDYQSYSASSLFIQLGTLGGGK